MNLVQVQDISFISIHLLSQTELIAELFFHEKKGKSFIFHLDIFLSPVIMSSSVSAVRVNYFNSLS